MEADVLERRRSNRRLLVTLCTLAGVLLLVTATVSTVTLVQQSTIEASQDKIRANQAKITKASLDARDLALNARKVVIAGCKSDNDTRSTIRTIIKRGEASLRQFKTEGLLNEAQLQRGLKQNAESLKLLSNRNCEAAARRIPLPKAR